MAKKCPNVNHPDYKLMVDLFGPEDALYIYDSHGEEIPSRYDIAQIYKKEKGDELSDNNNPDVWFIENSEDLIERWRTDENGKRTKILQGFTPNKAKKLVTELRDRYPEANISSFKFQTDSKANTRIKVIVPFEITEPIIEDPIDKVSKLITYEDSSYGLSNLNGKLYYNNTNDSLITAENIDSYIASVEEEIEIQTAGGTHAFFEYLENIKNTGKIQYSGIRFTYNNNEFLVEYDPDGYLRNYKTPTGRPLLANRTHRVNLENAARSLLKEAGDVNLNIPELNFKGKISDFISYERRNISLPKEEIERKIKGFIENKEVKEGDEASGNITYISTFEGETIEFMEENDIRQIFSPIVKPLKDEGSLFDELSFDQRRGISNDPIPYLEYRELRDQLHENFPHVKEIIEDPTMSITGRLEAGGTRLIVNPVLLTKSTIGHEFGHLMIDLAGGLDNPLVRAGLKELQGTELETRVTNAYPELVQIEDSRLDKEILSEALGKETYKIFKEEQDMARWERWLVRFFRRLKILLGIEKSAVRKLANQMMTQDQSTLKGEVASEYNRKALSGYNIVDDIKHLNTDKRDLIIRAKDTLQKKIGIYKQKNESTYVTMLESELEELQGEPGIAEGLIRFVKVAERQVGQLYKRYITAKEKYDDGNKNAFSTKMLQTWFEYISAFDLIDEVKEEIKKTVGFDKLKKEHKMSFETINDIIDMKNEIKRAYRTYGYEYLADFLLNDENPIYTRIAKDAEIRAEKEWLNENKDTRGTLEDYKKKFLGEHANKIKNDSRLHLIAELKEAQFDITYLERWVGNAPDINDPIVSVMIKAISLQNMKARKEGIEFVNKMYKKVQALEKVVPERLFSSPEKRYSFMMEHDEKTKKPTGSIIHPFKSTMIKTYIDYKTSINEDIKLSDLQKESKIRAWKDKNVPLNKKKFKAARKSFIKDELYANDKITAAEMERVFANDAKKRPKNIVFVLKDNVEAAEAINQWVYRNAWDYREPIEKWRNPEWKKFDKIDEKDPRKEFYNFTLAAIEESDSWLSQKYRLNWYGLSYQIPTIEKDITERIVEGQKPVTIMEKAVGMDITKHQYDVDRGQVGETGEKEVIVDELDKVKMFLPMYYSGVFDIKNQSFDIATAVNKRYQSALNYKYKYEILSEVELSKYLVETRKVVFTDTKGNPLKNANKLLRKRELTKEGAVSLIALRYADWLKAEYYGQRTAEGVDVNVFGMKVNSEKAIDMLNANTAYVLLGLNAVQGIANYGLGEIMQRIEAHGGEFYTPKNYFKASRKYEVHLPEIIADLSRRRYTNLVDLIGERLNILDDYKRAPKFRKKGFFQRMMRTDTLFFTNHVGEHMMQHKAAMAMLDNILAKDKEGNTIKKNNGKDMTLMDAFYAEDGVLKIDDRVAITDHELDIISFKIQRKLADMHGDYTDEGRMAIQRWALGRMGGMFRKFIPTGIKRRYASSRKLEDGTRQYKYNEFGEYNYEGTYRTTARFMGSLIKDLFKMRNTMQQGFSEGSKYNQLTQLERANLIKTAGEVGFLMTTIILGSIFLQKKGEADDERTKWYYSMLAYQALRLKSELLFFVNPVETFRILRSPAASMSVIENLIKLVTLVVNPFDDESAGARFQGGDWEGRLKASKYLTNSLGFMAPIKQASRWINIESQLNWFDN